MSQATDQAESAFYKQRSFLSRDKPAFLSGYLAAINDRTSYADQKLLEMIEHFQLDLMDEEMELYAINLRKKIKLKQ